MGIYASYLAAGMTFDQIATERNKQLQRISQIRGRDVVVYAADSRKPGPVTIDGSDILPLQDLLSDLQGNALDVLIETPGGSGEVAEQIVRLFRAKYPSVAFVIPGMAKSAGTIIVMSGDEILMSPTSALGPIDAQLQWQGKTFSAEALLEGVEKIKEEVERTGKLNRAYIPILQGISPGELQSAENSLNFAKVLVTEWLARYKFQNWERHSSTGAPVTDDEKTARAREIADRLCNHREWLTHGRPILLADLEAMRVIVTDYTQERKLGDAITRYYALLQMTFDSPVYKVFESHRTNSQIYRLLGQSPTQPAHGPGPQVQAQDSVNLDLNCNKCGAAIPIQANFLQGIPLGPGRVPYPSSDQLPCPGCGIVHDLRSIRAQIEAQTGRSIVP